MSVFDAYPKATARAFKSDQALNRRAGYMSNDCQTSLGLLLTFGEVEVGRRESCGTTDYTLFAYREWVRVLKALRSEGAVIKEEPIKHGNSWATKAGGFWSSTRYTLESVR